MKKYERKDIQINVRMKRHDLDLFERAAERFWPYAEISKPAMILSLAKMAAAEILKKK